MTDTEGTQGQPGHWQGDGFSVTREDDCIYLRDEREGGSIEIHLVPDQAREVAKLLTTAAE